MLHVVFIKVEIPLKGAKIDGDDRAFRKIRRCKMLFAYICNIVVYGLVILDVLNCDPCEKKIKHQDNLLLKSK